MRGIIFKAPQIKRLFNIEGITLFPFIFFADKEHRHNRIMMNHEKIHLRQQVELLVIPFYLIYVGEYLFHLLRLKKKEKAYMAVSFEKEAHANDSDLGYLRKRKFWEFTRYY